MSTLNKEAEQLKQKVIEEIKKQGFKINPHLRPESYDKEVIRNIHAHKRMEQLNKHSKFLKNNFENATQFLKNGEDIDPSKIDLELIEIKDTKSIENKIFFWWNLTWWSLPYTKPIGRQMRFVLWDIYHDSPFGLLGLQSPPLRSKVRDEYLGLRKEESTYWINQSLYGQRIGALPPYNQLLGAKMVALSMISAEIKDAYHKKYHNKKTLMDEKIIPAELLFFTTTGAFGKSSVYDRIKYNGRKVTNFIGYTTGRGTFHIPEKLYIELLEYLEKIGENVERGYGTGPSRKLRLINKATKKLGLSEYIFHNIKRSYYIIHNVDNLIDVIHNDSDPSYYNDKLEDLFQFWKKRWCIPRSKRIIKWKKYDKEGFLNKIKNEINY
jgi:hypothetical protein